VHRKMSRAAFTIAAGTNRVRRAAGHLRVHWPDYLVSIFGFGTDEITVSEAATRNQRWKVSSTSAPGDSSFEAANGASGLRG
jgi:hypothetical protein